MRILILALAVLLSACAAAPRPQPSSAETWLVVDGMVKIQGIT